MSLAFKSLIGIGGVVTAGIWGLYYCIPPLIPSTLGQTQKIWGYELVTDDATLDKLVEKYKNPGNIQKISGFELSSASSDNKTEKERFKEKCKELWDTKLLSAENGPQRQKDLRNWCVTGALAIDNKSE